MYQKCTIITKRGEEYIQPLNTTTKIEIGDAITDIKGLFDGNMELGTKKKTQTIKKPFFHLFFFLLAKVTNDVINDNIQELFHEVKPVLENIITRIGEGLLFKSLESAIPFSKLYPVS